MTDFHVVMDVSVPDVAYSESAELRYEQAFEYWDDLFRFLLAWTNDWIEAEDLAQETYLRLWQHRLRIAWNDPIRPWLFVTARHLANDRFRAMRSRALRAWVGRSTGFDEAVEARWLDVQLAMGKLSALERTALVLTAIEGWSYAQAAEALATTDGALRAAVSRARSKLEVA